MYSYVIEVADSESDLGFCNRGLVSEIFAFYHLLENSLRRSGRRGHVHLVINKACPNSAPPIDFYGVCASARSARAPGHEIRF